MADGQGPVCVSVINMKGGVGKTTIAAMLARYSASLQPFRWGYSTGLNLKTLAVDLDPQANLSQSLMGEYGYRGFIESRAPSIVEIFKGYQPPTPSNPSPDPLNVDNVVHSSYGHGGDRVQVIPSRFDFSDNLIESVKPDPRVLARIIAENFKDKDLVLIDCAPTESVFTRAAYHASRYVLVPVRPEFFATIGFPLLKESLDNFKKGNPTHHIDVIGIIINNAFYDGGNDGGPEKRRAMNEIYEEAGKNGWHIFENELPHSRGFPKLMRGDFDRLRNALDAFPHFAEEFFERIGLS